MNERSSSTGRWVDRVFGSPLPGGNDQRFTWPLPADIPAAQERLKMVGTPFVRATMAMARAQVLFQEAVRLYVSDFATLAGKSLGIQLENVKCQDCPSEILDASQVQSAVELQKLMGEMVASATKESIAYWNERAREIMPKVLVCDLEGVATFWEKQVTVLDIVVNRNPKALKAIGAQMGCKWDDESQFTKITETSRAILYQVLPRKSGVSVRNDGKPIIVFSPLILKHVILDLLSDPKHEISYVAALANSGTPTFFVRVRDIESTPEAQIMTEEELLLDLRFFAKTVFERCGRRATFNGVCQGALPLLHAVCSPALGLDKYVDCWLGLVPAYSLHASLRVRSDLEKIPEKKRNDLQSITELLGSGNRVVPGEIAGFATRLKTDPWTALVRAMRGAEKGESSLMGLAIQEYLQSVIPMSVSMMEMSHTCAIKPIASDGVFPTQLFGEPVSLGHAIKQGIKLYVVAGEKDEVVDQEASLRMFELPCIKKYKGASYHVVPGAGHIALMTTCARESSKNFIGNEGGPLWFHLKEEAATVEPSTTGSRRN